MLYVLHGPDTLSGREKLHTLLTGVQAKRPGASLFRMTSETLNAREIEDLSGARGLFEAKHIVLLDLVLSNKESLTTVTDLLPAMAESENLFVLFEGEIDAKTLSLFKKHAAKVQSHSEALKEDRGREVFNRFALPDALGKRDRKLLWVLYRKALLSEMAEEEIHGLLFWQVKSMLLASTSKNAQESGLKPFVYSKAKSAALNYSSEELFKLSNDLVTLYHDARRGVHEFEVALERFVLSI